MRQERTVQASIFDVFAGHEIGRELKAMSDWLDAHRALLGLVAAVLRRECGGGPLLPPSTVALVPDREPTASPDRRSFPRTSRALPWGSGS